MSKKTKRQARKTAVATSSALPRTVSTNGSRAFEREFNPDYSYVIKDLRRIGVLAGSFFMILVVLSFFLR
jgi:hypothetical protein